jgi:hypothetical protein
MGGSPCHHWEPYRPPDPGFSQLLQLKMKTQMIILVEFSLYICFSFLFPNKVLSYWDWSGGFLQKYHHRFLDALFSGLSCVVSVPFYTAFLPLLFWVCSVSL